MEEVIKFYSAFRLENWNDEELYKNIKDDEYLRGFFETIFPSFFGAVHCGAKEMSWLIAIYNQSPEPFKSQAYEKIKYIYEGMLNFVEKFQKCDDKNKWANYIMITACYKRFFLY